MTGQRKPNGAPSEAEEAASEARELADESRRAAEAAEAELREFERKNPS